MFWLRELKLVQPPFFLSTICLTTDSGWILDCSSSSTTHWVETAKISEPKMASYMPAKGGHDSRPSITQDFSNDHVDGGGRF